ncbi:MAG: hypothetical protein Q9P44_06755 [Anaerolineae bacterium]|nr:hypothetical protein [Anaerolineae bacterium]
MPLLDDEILAIAVATECNVFVESGTFYGQTFARIIESGLFERCYSVEIQQHLYENLQNQFPTTRQQQVFLGTSYEQFVQSIFPLCDADDTLFFWLDGHFSAGETGGAEFPCPIIDELQSIAQHCPTSKVVIAIDDTDDLGRKDSGVAGYNWASRAEIEAAAQAISPDLHLIDYTGDSDSLPKINRGVLIFSYRPVDAKQLELIQLPQKLSQKQGSLWQRLRRLFST